MLLYNSVCLILLVFFLGLLTRSVKSRFPGWAFWGMIVLGPLWLWIVKALVGLFRFPAAFLKTPIDFLTGSVTPNLTHSLLAALPFWICAVACKLILRTSQDKPFASMGRIGGTAGMSFGLLAASLYLYFDVWQVVLINKNFAHGWTLGLYTIALIAALPLNYGIGWAAGDLLDEGRNTHWKAVLAPVRFTLVLGCFILLTLGLREVRATKHLLDIYFKGKSLAMAGKGSEALAELKKAAGIKARIGRGFIGKAHNMIGFSLVDENELELAEAAFQTALTFPMDNDNTAIAHVNLGNIYLDGMYRIDDARRHFEQAIAASPDLRLPQANMYAVLAEIYLAQGNETATLQTIQNGLRRVPGDGLHIMLACYHSGRGERQEALRVLQNELKQTNPSVKLMLMFYAQNPFDARKLVQALRDEVNPNEISRLFLFDRERGVERWNRSKAERSYLSYVRMMNSRNGTKNKIYFPCPKGQHCHMLIPACCRWLTRSPRLVFDHCEGPVCETTLKRLLYAWEWDDQVQLLK